MLRRVRATETSPCRQLATDAQGAVFTEYLIVMAFAGLVVALAMAALGPKTVQGYSGRRGLLYDAAHP